MDRMGRYTEQEPTCLLLDSYMVMAAQLADGTRVAT